MKKILFAFTVFMLLTVGVFSGASDSSWLYGIHWYGSESASDVEAMSGGKGVWILDTTFTDSSQADSWELAANKYWYLKSLTTKGHSLVIRLQPNWSRNVPNASDPYTLSNYANDAKSAATSYSDICHIWVVGNEVNITGENNKWNSGTSKYDTEWQPTPEQYAQAYLAVRDKIHEATATTSPSDQVVLMQPVSPGSAVSVRYMDGSEFLYRQIAAVSDKSKIDGFALHAYGAYGAANYGVDGYMDSLREQLMVIDSFGLTDRPIFITEWAQNMPDEASAKYAAKFCYNSLAAMNTWNSSSDGEWQGLPNHRITGAMWFIYREDVNWNSYSLFYWKSRVTPADKDNNPWYAFQYAAGLNYAKGAPAAATSVLQDSLWWEDSFNGTSLDKVAPFPDWEEENGGGATVSVQNGQLRLIGANQVNSSASVKSAGYVYGNFNFDTEIVFTNANRASSSIGEANFDIRLREGSKGYSITFFTNYSGTNTNKIVLRRTNDWTQIGSYQSSVDINTGDKFRVSAVLDSNILKIKIYKNDAATSVVNWNVTDSGQNVGWVRLITWNLNEARVNYAKMGGTGWSRVEDWK